MVESQRHLTVSGQFLGTLAYASPEQCEDKGIDSRSDLYSLGVVLYECVSGRLPYEHTTSAALIRDILLSDPIPIRSLAPLDRGRGLAS
jgi:serine/threonine-protein kinase